YTDASFVKIRNIVMGYSLPSSLVSKWKMSSMRVYANILNPFVFTKYEGWDPEYATTGLSDGNGPSNVTYQLGVNVRFELKEKKMKNIIYACIVGVIALSGCAKFIEEDNRGGITNDEFYRTEAGYRSIVNSSYATLRTTFGRQAPWLLLGGTDIYQMNREQANRALMEY